MVLILFGAMQSHSDIWNTAYYATATEVVHKDLNTLIKLAGSSKFNLDRSTHSERLINTQFCNEDEYMAVHRASTAATVDPKASSSIAEWHAVARGLLSVLADGCDESDYDCAAALGRLSTATGSQDLLSDYVTERILEVMCAWRDLIVYEPELAPSLPDAVPRPYPYPISSTLDEERDLGKKLQDRVSIYLSDLKHSAVFYGVESQKAEEFKYSPDAFVPRISERSTFAEALTDFLLIRASQEVLYYLIQKTRGTPADERHAFEVFLPHTMSFLNYVNITEIATLVPALRSAVGDDMRTLPERLMVQSSTDSDLSKLYEVLEFIRNGLAPGVALARLVDHESERKCGPLAILGIVAREWNAVVTSTKTTIGGLDRVAVQQMKSQSDVLPRPFVRHLFKQDGNTIDHFLKCNFGSSFDYELEDLTGEVYWYRDVVWRIEKEVAWRIEKENELVDLVTGLFLRLEQIYRMVADVRSAESNEPNGEVDGTASSGNPGAEISEVLRVTTDAIELVVDTAATATSDGDDALALKLWLQAYRALVDKRYADAVAAALRYVYTVPITNNAEVTFVRGSIEKIEPLITLGASLLEAESSEELQAALYAATAPVGSSALKHQPGQHVTIGAYVGASVGLERKIPDPKWDNLHLGPALPLGVGLTFGPPKRSGNKPNADSCCPFGIFLSPVDLGVVANIRINDLLNREAAATAEAEEDGSEGEKESPKIEHAVVGWEQLFAPSAYAVLHLSRDLPMALAIGVQYSPKARMGATKQESSDALRLSLMLAIDVTLFSF